MRRTRTRTVASVTVLATTAVLALVAACTPQIAPLEFPDATSPVSTPDVDVVGPLRMDGEHLIDGAGRTVLLHGINAVQKNPPFIASLDDGALGPRNREYYRNSGFNSIRLGVSYAALMPDPGEIDEEYLDSVLKVVDELGADGFWVQLDFHQDVFHLMPDWATPPDAAALSDEAPELLSFIGWAAQYMSPRSIRQWDSFLAGEPHVGGRSVAAVLGDAAAALAARAADRDHVIGIELLNEPFSGSAVVRCIVEGCPDKEAELSERYSEMIDPIRAAAPQMPIWLEPFAPTALAAPATMPVPAGVTPAADGAQLGLAWHLYCEGTDGGAPVLVDPVTTNWCNLRFDNGFRSGAAMAAGLGGARVLNEFGASRNPLDVTFATERADEAFVSWMYWHAGDATTPFDSDIEDSVEAQIVRPYPQATAGTPIELRYAPATGEFDYRFTPGAAIDAPTSIVVPPRAYPTGYEIDVVNGSVTSPADAGLVTVSGDGSGSVVEVSIRRR